MNVILNFFRNFFHEKTVSSSTLVFLVAVSALITWLVQEVKIARYEDKSNEKLYGQKLVATQQVLSQIAWGGEYKKIGMEFARLGYSVSYVAAGDSAGTEKKH